MVRVVLLSLFFIVVSCGNPLGGGSDHSEINNGHQPLNPGGGTVDATMSSIQANYKHIAADNSEMSTITVTIRDSNGSPLPDKYIELTSSRGTSDIITPANAVTNVSGEAVFTVRSAVLGESSLTATETSDTVEVTQKQKIYFISETPLVDLLAEYAAGLDEGVNGSGGTTAWINTGTGGTAFNGSLSHFSLDGLSTQSRWGGDGTTTMSDANTGQYRLIFDGVDDSIDMGTGLNAYSSLAFETWIRPSHLERGSVIASNADTNSKGLTLRESWDGRGRLTLHSGHQSYAEVILNDNPVGYWRLGEAAGSATYYNSTSEAGLNATVVAGITSGTGALANDTDDGMEVTKTSANNGALTVSDHVDLDNTTALSIEAWLNLSSSCNSGVCGIVSKRTNQNLEESYILYANNRQIAFRVNGTAGEQLNSSTLTVGTWYHVVAVFDGSLDNTGTSPSANHRMKIYLNGNLTVTRSFTATSIPGNASDFSIGHLFGNNTSGWGGSLDEVAVYKYALTSTQVLAHYNARTKHAVHADSNLSVGAWSHVAGSFDQSTGLLSLSHNGVNTSKAFSSTNISGSTSSWILGASNFSGTFKNHWEGAISEFRAYPYALSGTELNACYTATNVKYP